MKPESTAPQSQPETKPLPKLAQIAVRELQKNMNAAMFEIATESATALGLDPNLWEFDLRTLTFVKKET